FYFELPIEGPALVHGLVTTMDAEPISEVLARVPKLRGERVDPRSEARLRPGTPSVSSKSKELGS
ncbi:MAG: hypothetical protein JWN04_5889, partial [Myxococcaceae bacterium]|nr:hypothetical protein [Myxococcaceae bacterium]